MRRTISRERLISVGVLLGIAAPFVGVYGYLQDLHARSLQRHVEVVCTGLTTLLEEQLAVRLALLESTAREIALGGLSEGRPFETRALELQQSFPGYLAINLISPDGIISQVVPLGPNQAALGRQVREHPQAGPYFVEAQQTHRATLTPPLTLFQGGLGFASYFPVSEGAEGYLNGVFRIAPMIERLLDDATRADFQVEVFVDAESVFISRPGTALSDVSVRQLVSVYGQDWSVELRPAKPLVSSFYPLGTPALLFVGLLGAVLASLLASRELTARIRRRQLDEQLRQSRRMEALGTLAGGIAHDFNNLLTVISVTLELSLIELDPSSRVHRDLTRLLSVCGQGSTLTRQLLSFTQPRLVPGERFLAEAALEEAGRLLERMLPKSIRFSMQVDSPETWLKGDAGELQQVIVNLVINARDAMPDGGQLLLRAATSSRRGRPVFIVEVSDTGVGMDAATRERIFDPFFTTKPLGKGTGLGLAMVYRSVEGMGGEISVTSAPGEGSTFRMVFPGLPPPTTRVETPVSPPQQPLPLASRKARILVVEDDDTIRDKFAQALSLAGHEVTAAPGGEAALALCRDGAPLDLLVTDVVMPGIGGVALAEQLTARRPGLRVLFCTGYSDQQIDIQAHAGRAVLIKPFPLSDLTAAVEALLGGNAQR